MAKKENVDFAVTGKLTGKTDFEMFDITTLMGNVLQNALEAAVQAAIPKIRVELIEHEKEIFIVVSNSMAKEMSTTKSLLRTSKADTANHGFGLKNIDAVVRKHHGEYYMESVMENGDIMFKISIAIPKENKI